jgi:hypothetical protein
MKMECTYYRQRQRLGSNEIYRMFQNIISLFLYLKEHKITTELKIVIRYWWESQKERDH